MAVAQNKLTLEVAAKSMRVVVAKSMPPLVG